MMPVTKDPAGALVGRDPAESGTARPTAIAGWLAAASIALCSAGVVGRSALGLPTQIPAFWIPGGLLLLHTAATASVIRRPVTRAAARTARTIVVLMMVLSVPVVANPLSLNIWGYFTFTAGTLMAVCIALEWDRRRASWSMIDWGLSAFVLVTSARLLRSVTSAANSQDAHQASVAGVGGSNYIGALLVIASLIMLGRLREVRRHWLVFLVPVVGMTAAASTLSRGSIVAAVVGIAVHLISRRRLNAVRTISFGAAVAFAAYLSAQLVSRVTEARSVGGYDPEKNVEARTALVDASLAQFGQSPVFGTGWFQLREATSGIGSEVSFAHNLFASFLQIAGVFGASFLVLLTVLWIVAFRRHPPLRGALIAAGVVAMVEPVLEGGQGNLLVWIALAYGCVSSLEPLKKEFVDEQV